MTASINPETPRVLIVKRRALEASETFIEAHVREVPNASFYSPPRPAGLRRLLFSALLRVRREYLAQGWGSAVRRYRPDVVLAEYGPTGTAVMHACERAGVPLVVYFHGYDAVRQATVERHRAQYVELFEYASAIVAASRALADELVRLGAPKERLHHIPCGVDISRFAGARPQESALNVVAVGRLVEKKAPHLTIRAFAIAHERHPESKLVIIGDGELRSRCESLVNELNLADCVSLLGAQPHDVVVREMLSARLFVQHSMKAPDGDTEGTPVAITEAQACGLPVVATRHGGIPDVVGDGCSGFLVAEGDVDGMAAAITRLLDDASLAREMGDRGRAIVSERFSLAVTIGALAKVLREAAGSRAQTR